jgi:hypothetical protein
VAGICLLPVHHVVQVGELFTASATVKSGSSSSSSSLLQQVLQEDEADASELYFGSMDTAGEGSNSPEAVAWRQKSSAICQQLTPLQRSQVGKGASSSSKSYFDSCFFVCLKRQPCALFCRESMHSQVNAAAACLCRK